MSGMASQQAITVEWFDELKGIGEGKSSSGQVIFLNSDNIEASNRFLTLKPGEKIVCETQTKDGHLFASKIVRTLEERTQVEKSTFIEPLPLEKNLDPVI
jgi:cold shock CspA family protein